jgi:carbamoyltransferase
MNILAIQEGHTATAALSKNGEIIGSVSEERFLRKKNWEGYPRNAITYLSGLVNGQIDKVVLCGQLTPGVSIVGREHNFSVLDHINQQRENFYPIYYKNQDPFKTQKNYFKKIIKEKKRKLQDTQFLFNKNFKFTCDPSIDINRFNEVRVETISKHLNIPRKNILFLDHHIGHVYYAYYASPFRKKNCLVITADGDGDYGINATVSIVKNDKITEIFRTDKQPIAKLWRYFTLMLGMKPQQHEYKVMGMAPYADPNISNFVYKVLKSHFSVNNLKFVTKKKPKDLYFYFRNLFEGVRFDGLAGGLQKWTEEMTKRWIENIIKKTKISRIVLSGGLSMNIKSNKVVNEIKDVKEFFVPASGGDESLPIGGCYYLSSKFSKPKPLNNIYLGPKYNDDQIKKILTTSAKKFKIIKIKSLDEVSRLLKKGLIVARFSGRMEFGARALGNRSILANPSLPETLKKINSKIKQRDFWMPFTPIILKENKKDYIIDKKNTSCPHMTIAFDTTPLGRNHFKAAIHPYDQTVRPQILEKKHNQNLYNLIKSFKKVSGIGGILNTSFNLHGFPIVCNPKDAIETLKKSDLDGVLFNDKFLVMRKRK